MVSVRFLIDESLEWRQFGCVLFHIRNFLDSLDGIIYRAHMKQRVFKSNYGSLGYLVDAVSDTVGGVCLTLSIAVLLCRRRPVVSRNQKGRFRACLDSLDKKILPAESSEVAQTNGGYSLVIEMDDVDHKKLTTRHLTPSLFNRTFMCA